MFSKLFKSDVSHAVAKQRARRKATECLLPTMVCASKRSRNNQGKQ